MSRIPFQRTLRSILLRAVPLLALGLAACGGGSTSNPGAGYTIGGSLSGLSSGTKLQLLKNGGDALSLSANGTFQFATPVTQGQSYLVTVGTQPSGQTCVLGNASGSNVSAAVSTVTLTCRTSYAFVTNDDPSGTISMYALGATGALTALSTSPLPAASNPANVAITPNGAYAYVASSLGSKIQGYAVSGSAGLTALAAASASVPSNPTDLIVDPSGRFIYTVSQSSKGQVTALSIDPATGALAVIGSVNANSNTIRVATDPLGKFLYAVDSGDSLLSEFSIGATTGALTSIGTLTTGGTAAGIAVASTTSGAYVYVALDAAKAIYAYAVNPTTGLLTQVGSPVATSNTPWGLVVDRSQKYLYAAGYGANVVYEYSIDSNTGALTPIGSGSIPAGTGPARLAVDPSNRYLYVTNYGGSNVSQYTIGGTGQLAAMTAPTVPSGSVPTGVAVY